MDNHRTKAVLGFLVLAAVLGLASWRLLAPVAGAGSCDLSSQPCPLSLGDQELLAELLPRYPAPGEEFLLILRSAPGTATDFDPEAISPEGVTVEFSMPGMDMGEHQMQLQPTADGTLGGRIALPSCPMGHSLWQATVRVGEEPVADWVLHVGQ
ncbi:MAG: hypothetical protein SX243_08160 [Acidobacteriota bacterium]|nr:hypothetical protein [Acidobacteriota bacterium]